MKTKKCTTCKEIKKVSFFHKDKTTKDGFVSQCKQCRKRGQNSFCVDCGKELSKKTYKRCEKCAGKIHSKRMRGKNNPLYGIKPEKHPRWKGGKPKCIDCGIQLSDWRNKRCKSCNSIGANSSSYIDGRTPLREMIRFSSKNKKWREQVFKRDNFTCQECGCNIGGQFQAHHTKQLSQILSEFLAFYDNFSPIEDKETLLRLSFKWEDFWNIDNGITLCKKCHSHKPRKAYKE